MFAKHVSDKDLCPENIKILHPRNRDSKTDFRNGQKRDFIQKSMIFKTCKLETTLISINRRRDKQAVTHSDGRLLLGNEKEQPTIHVTVWTQENTYYNFRFM